MPAPSALKIGRTDNGYSVRVEGAGKMKESRAVQEFVVRTLGGADAAESAGSVAVDLSACEYLDSTFLGSLVFLSRRFGQAPPGSAARFRVAAPSEKCRKS